MLNNKKYETIIRRNIGTTRARDFYDLYMFFNLYKDRIDSDVLKMAVTRTSKKRNSLDVMAEWQEIIDDMRADPVLLSLWSNYCKNNEYALDVKYEDVMDVTHQIAEMLDF